MVSQATSIDDLSQMESIDGYRPMYDFRRSLSEANTRGSPLKHKEAYSPTASISRLPTTAFSPEPETKGKAMTGQGGGRHPDDEDEEVLRETEDRFVVFPIKYREVSAAYTTKLMADLECI